MKWKLGISKAVAACMLHMCSVLSGHAQLQPRYHAEDGEIKIKNGKYFHNRPLYCNNTDAFILTGDKPLVRFVQTPFVYGSFMLGIVHSRKLKWLVDCGSILSSYRGNMMRWDITDPDLDSLAITLTVLPASGSVGMCIRAQLMNQQAGDTLIWKYGGAAYLNEGSLSWTMDVVSAPSLLQTGFVDLGKEGNVFSVSGNRFVIENLRDTSNHPARILRVEGVCPENSSLRIERTDFPLIRGAIPLRNDEKDFIWNFYPLDSSVKRENPSKEWTKGKERVESLYNRIQVETPDQKLNALAAASVSVIDAVWYDPVFVHGAMLWNIPFPGWRTMYGGVMYGWHERVLKEARHYISFQNRADLKRFAKADTALLSTIQDQQSRFFGAGHIDRDQWVYNFQSQFFEQLITAWRSTTDSGLERILFPALTLHLQWQEECFDPDGDGVYESYLNSWPTDSQWYNGGGTAEETAYAFNGHRAAAEMAERRGDSVAAARHRLKMRKIRKGFYEKLWIRKKGHSGAYREQGGYQRLHENPWLASIFLPIDVGFVEGDEAISSLFYTKSALQNDVIPGGGRMVWSSNWVPGVFSVRELYPGDNYHLALAYFLSGMAEEGWDIMKGTFGESAYNGNVPGDLGAKKGGTDFNDCSSMFTRVLIEGLFGYRPDYPKKRILFTPQLPKEWNNASIRTPDFSFRFERKDKLIDVNLCITKPAQIHASIPISKGRIKQVYLNGRLVSWKWIPGYHKGYVGLILDSSCNSIQIELYDDVSSAGPLHISTAVDKDIDIAFAGDSIFHVSDRQRVFQTVKLKNGFLRARISNSSGKHTVVVKTMSGKVVMKKIIYLNVTEPPKNSRQLLVSDIPVNVNWQTVSFHRYFNADVRTIYQQKYNAPRPGTVSARIGTDGYSAWTYLFWKQLPPRITLDSFNLLSSGKSILQTKQGVPFQFGTEAKNIAFTSLWENWPRKVTVPVKMSGRAIWFLVAGSTNQMQCDIANAVIYLNYSDGTKDSLLLIPPYNYWNLSPINIKAGAAGQESRSDYTDPLDAFAVPKPWPETVSLGANCRAMLLNRILLRGKQLESVTIQTLSEEVVVGLMGITIMQ